MPDSPEEARRLALKAAGGAAALLREREDLSKDLATNAFVDDIFSVAYDLLGGHRHGPGGSSADAQGGRGSPFGTRLVCRGGASLQRRAGAVYWQKLGAGGRHHLGSAPRSGSTMQMRRAQDGSLALRRAR